MDFNKFSRGSENMGLKITKKEAQAFLKQGLKDAKNMGLQKPKKPKK
jgi:hypothetical protein